MPTLIACFIAGICVAGFVTFWLTTAYKELSEKRNNITDLKEQMLLHERLYSQAKNSPDARSAANMLDTSRMLCREAAKSYNNLRRKPMNRIPALLMGFGAADEKI